MGIRLCDLLGSEKESSGNAHGTGFWNYDEDELLLLGIRGWLPCPAPGTQWLSRIRAPVGRHSEKLKIVYKLIKDYFPTLPAIELNCRGKPWPGFDAWGNEAEEADVGAGEADAAEPELPLRPSGLVRVDATHVVAPDFVTPDERSALLAAAADAEGVPALLRAGAAA